MTSVVSKPAILGQPAIPPLKNGDHLKRDEFLRRWDAMPELKKAELIQGRVYVASPVNARDHGEPHALVVGILITYMANTPTVKVGDNSTTILGEDDVPQPDAYLRLDSARGGQSLLTANGYIEGAPELIIEVAATSADYDLHEKLETYEAAGVKEYIVWRTYDGEVDCFSRTGSSRFVRKAADADGVYRSTTFPGLWLNLAALVRQDLATLLPTVQQGLASPEHHRFITAAASPRQQT
jgi:Uma2 family endonuclease